MQNEKAAPAAWRHAAVFAAGLALGGAGVWLALDSRGPASTQDPGDDTAAAPRAAVATKPVAGASRTQVAAPARAVMPCPAQPVAVAAPGGKDGHFEMPADLSGDQASDVAHFILIGKEAAAGGRPRDAEVAFIMACKVAAKFTAAGSIESADARYQLARHYATLSGGAANGRPAAKREEMLRRSQALYVDALETYNVSLGATSEKTRYAAQGLAAVKGDASTPAPAAAVAVAKASAPATPPSNTSAPAPAPAAVAVAKASPSADAAKTAITLKPAITPKPSVPSRPAVVAVARAPLHPSFDCAQARSVPERLICRDPQLAQLDRELGRLHARAKNETTDPVGFRRRNDYEWRRREATCRDRDCVLRWYAQRRNQLLDEIDASNSPGTAFR